MIVRENLPTFIYPLSFIAEAEWDNQHKIMPGLGIETRLLEICRELILHKA
jgi:hypothetical protein